MAQKFPEIGLRAVFEIAGFQAGYRKYQATMSDIDKTTKQTAQKVNQSIQKMGAGFVSTFNELAQQSRKLTSFQKYIDDVSASVARLGETGGREAAEQLRTLNDEMISMSKTFQGLGKDALVNVAVFDQLHESGVNFSDALQVASGQMQFNLPLFDSLIQKGTNVGDAFQQAASSAGSASDSISILGRSFSITGVAITAATVALAGSIKFTKDAIEEYDELAEATRRIRLQTGLLTREASIWVTVAETAGISTGTLERGLAQFLSGVADLRRDMAEGKDLTNDFAKAIDTLGVSVVDSQGNLRSTDAILNDINLSFQELGPGIVSTQLAVDLFGRTGRQLLPSLIAQEKSLADLADQARQYGANLGAIDKEQHEELRQSQIRLTEATRGLKLEISRGWAEARTNWNNFWADVINGFRKVDAAFRALSSLNLGEILGDPGLWRERYEFFLTGESEAARAAEASAQARANAAQDIIASEAAIRRAREETLRQLDELKSQYASKLADIDADAARAWDDILVQRQREAFDRSLANVYRMDDLRRALNEKLDNIDRDFAKRWDDILVKRARDALVRAQREVWQDADLIRRRDRSRADAIRDASRRENEIRRDARKRVEDAERDAREKREKLERDHQRRLQDIRQQFLDTALEAARDNDAVAVARAMRVRARELRDEQRRYVDEQRDLEDSLKKKRQQIEEDRREREEDHRQELARTLQRIEENHQRQVEELARQRERQRILREQQEQWELEDFNKAKAEQLAAAQEWYDKQLEEMERQAAKEARLREIQYERQEIDFVKAWQRRIEDAREWYERERDELATHLDMTGQMLERAYEDWIRAAGEAVSEMTQALLNDIQRWQHALTEAERQAARVSRPTTRAPAPTQRQPGTRAVQGPDGIWRIPGAPVFGRGPGMAEGGVVQASSPTTITMGEAGPETAVFMPNRSSSMNVNHNFGRMGVDFQGLPGGMNTQQVQAIVYSVMTQLAKGVITQR